MENVKERPILMNTESVGGILGNRKTQTRRVIKPQPDYSILKKGVVLEAHKCPVLGPVHLGRKEWGLYGKPYQPTAVPCFAYDCPYGKIGDRLWVRETWQQFFPKDWERWPAMLDYYHKKCAWNNECKIFYKANGPEEHPEYGKVNWKPSIHISRIHSRIDLEITDIRIEKVQDISWDDLVAEGYLMENCINRPSIKYATMSALLEWFIPLWDSINAKRGYGWETNPYVWCISFKILD